VTITLAGSTGVSTTAAARGTTSTTVAYTAVAAGRMAIITASVRPSSATLPSSLTDGAGKTWTQVATATGGTGSEASDTGTSRIARYYRELDGAETGSVTITPGGSPSVTTASMDVYAKTRASWATPIGVTGADTSHGTNPTAASGTWAEALGVGDFVSVGYAADTDTTTATSGQAISQSGTTFATPTARSRVGNSSGNQASVFTWDAAVTAVTSGASTAVGATTMTLTWSVSSCGAFAAVRLREYAATSSVVDNFDDGTLAADIYGPDSYGTYGESSGRMSLTISTTYVGVYSVNKFRFDDVRFRAYPAVANGAATEAYSAFWLDVKDQADGTMLGFFYDSINDQLYLASWVGYSDASQVVLNAAAASFPYWRLLRSGSNVLWQTSPDGSTWTTQRTAAMPTWLANGTAVAMWWEGHRADGTANTYTVDELNTVAAIIRTTTGTGAAEATARSIATSSRATARSAVAEATARATAGKSALRSGTATADATATAARTTARGTIGKLTAEATARSTSSSTRVRTGTAAATATATSTRSTIRATARTAAATATATSTAGKRVAYARTAAATATAVGVSAGRRPTARVAVANATATAASGTLRVTTGTASANATARATTGSNEQHTSTGTAAAQATARSTAAKRVARTGTAAASATATAARVTARTTTGTAAATATARATTGAETVIVTTGTAAASATARATAAKRVARAGTAAAAATASSSSTTRHTSTGTGVAVATATATTGASEQHTTAGRAQASATARASTGAARATTGTAAATATAYGRAAGTSGRPPIVSSSRPSRLLTMGRSSRITSTTRPTRVG
jgi:hypothetical protein